MPEKHGRNAHFGRIARYASDALGTAGAFVLALAIVLFWGLSGPLFHFSDTWQLVINTGTTIVTFLMVFLVQHTQNRESRALHLKIDELLRSAKRARNQLIDLEHCSDDEIAALERQFHAMRTRSRSGA
ncbi:MAG: low affinity iron permease family protein [Hyphomicrobiaceae bacterium]